MAYGDKPAISLRSSAPGTGTFTVTTESGYLALTNIADGNTAKYMAEEINASTGVPTGAKEWGMGTVGSTGTTLARTTIYGSTNGGSAVNFTGTVRISITFLPEGPVAIRQNGGTVGTDDALLYHDGTDFRIDTNSGAILINSPSTDLLGLRLGASGNYHHYFTYNAYRLTASACVQFGETYGTDGSLRCPAGTAVAGQIRIGGKQTDDPGVLVSIPYTPAQITADQNNYNPGAGGWYYRLDSDASRNITGLSVGQTNGYPCEIWNVGSNNIVLVHQSASSSTANRFINATGADITLASGEMAFLRWFTLENSSSGGWRVVKGT